VHETDFLVREFDQIADVVHGSSRVSRQIVERRIRQRNVNFLGLGGDLDVSPALSNQPLQGISLLSG
jgi:hypothetical protein